MEEARKNPIAPPNPTASGSQQARIPITIAGYYANGYEINFSGADVTIMFAMNGRPAFSLNLSSSTAKALGAGLTQMIEDVEKLTESKIWMSNDIVELQQKAEAKAQ